jgi:hypothetical protein
MDPGDLNATKYRNGYALLLLSVASISYILWWDLAAGGVFGSIRHLNSSQGPKNTNKRRI